jgi:uridine kinase
MSLVFPSQTRETVQVKLLPNGQVYEAPYGTPLLAFFQRAEHDSQTPAEARAVAAMVDNRLRELTYPVVRDLEVRPITLYEMDGIRIYRRSLSFLLIAAVHACFPDAEVIIDHALPQRAFACHVENRPNFTAAELDQINRKMRELVNANLPITRTAMSLAEAQEYFAQRGDEEKVRLLQFRTRDYLRIYTLGDFSDYFFGYMVPTTGYLLWFDLEIAEIGFLLRYPDENKPNMIQPLQKLGKMSEVFRETGRWLKLLEVRDIGQLNQVNATKGLRELILIAEALHERRIAEIGQQIAERVVEGVRLILIAGPSSSGKTTFSKRLAIQLMTHGLKPFTLELDNYFVDREATPRDENGEYDFESLRAINVDLLNQHVQALIAGEQVQLLRYDFHLGKSVDGRTVQLTPEHVIIMEGIHGLNPNLTPSIDPGRTYRIYVSALTQLNIDRYNRVSTTDVRLLRRIVRDATHRGWTATDTLARWESVGRGERQNIFPYQEQADVMFNSALVYELAALRPYAEPHLLRVNLNHPKWAEANRLLSFLSWVKPASDEGIPDNSILREFIGGSNLRDYHPGS